MSTTEKEIVSGDGVHLKVSHGALMEMEMIKNLLDVSEVQDAVDLDYHSADLKEIIIFCEYFAKLKENKDAATESDIQHFESEFLKRVTADKDQHLRMLRAADALIVRRLQSLLVKDLVAKLHNKSSEEIRKEWGITPDLTKEEEEEISGSTSWIQTKPKPVNA